MRKLPLLHDWSKSDKINEYYANYKNGFLKDLNKPSYCLIDVSRSYSWPRAATDFLEIINLPVRNRRVCGYETEISIFTKGRECRRARSFMGPPRIHNARAIFAMAFSSPRFRLHLAVAFPPSPFTHYIQPTSMALLRKGLRKWL